MLPVFREPLLRSLRQEEDPSARYDLVLELKEHADDDPVVVEALIERVRRDANWQVRRMAFRIAEQSALGRQQYVEELLSVATMIATDFGTGQYVDANERGAHASAQGEAIDFLVDYGEPADPRAVDALFHHLGEGGNERRARVQERLAEAMLANAENAKRVEEFLGASDVSIRNAARGVLGRAASLARERGLSAPPASRPLVLIADGFERLEADGLLTALRDALIRLADRLDDEDAQNGIYNEILPLLDRVKAAVEAPPAEDKRELRRRGRRTLLNLRTVAGLAKGVALMVSAVGGMDEAGENVARAADAMSTVSGFIAAGIGELDEWPHQDAD